MDRPVVLVGPPASGKTTVALALAARLGVPWADVDEALCRDEGCSVAELFAREGEPGFRARERRAFESLLRTHPRGVIAAGGGTLLDPALRRETLKRAFVLALDAPLEVLIERARREGGPARPLLAGDLPARLGDLLVAREGAYAECHARVSTAVGEATAVESALAALAELVCEPTLVVPLLERSYRVHVAPLSTVADRVGELSPSAVVLVTDAKVSRLVRLGAVLKGLAPGARAVLAGRGERDKTLAGVKKIWDAALGAGIDRDAVVLGVGGGVVTDMAGFAAATLLRGVRYASAPTTLLAMVDASVGGKTGFDHPRGKNLLGAFHQPSVVVCDPAVVRTQPARDVRAGLAEVAKIALVRDRGLLERLAREHARLAALEPAALAEVIPGAIQAKIDVVARDEREAGERAVLNFGHTLGHALEAGTGYRVPHGECVALGMRAALALGEALGETPPAIAREAIELLDALGLPAALPAGARFDARAARAALRRDKKRRAGELRFVLCDDRGSAVVRPVAEARAWEALRAVLETRRKRARPLPSP